jgi:hypothetical protein
MPKQRPQRAQAELERASEHLHYEIDRVEHLVKEIHTAPSDLVKHAVLEAFLVHARLVAHFVGWNRGGTPREDDILAEDFGAGVGAPTASPTVLTASVNEAIGKRVAHLTYAREHAKVDGYTWDVSGIAIELLGAVAAFVRSVNQANLSAKEWGPWKTGHSVVPGGLTGPLQHCVPLGVSVATGMAR